MTFRGLFQNLRVWFGIVLVLTVVSCRKSDRDLDKTTHTSRDFLIAETAVSDLFAQCHQLLANDSILSNTGEQNIEYDHETCIINITITTTSGSYPKTIYVDYGTTGFVNCNDNMSRKGKLSIQLSSGYTNLYSRATITPVNYYLNGFEVEGELIMTNLGNDVNGILHFVQRYSDLTVSNDTSSIDIEGRTEAFWVNGKESANVLDDDFNISGYFSGRTSKGNAYETSISTTVLRSIGCPFILSGKQVVTPSNLAPRTIDYGSGTCEKEISLLINGESKVFDVGL